LSVLARKDHWFSFGDCSIAVTERNPAAKAALFFLHGRFGYSECWAPVIEALSIQFRCISVDLPGFGRSISANDRGLSLLEHAELAVHLVDRFIGPDGKAVLVGHDIGGAVCELCAIQVPQRFAGLVLINTVCVSQPCPGLETGPLGLLSRRNLHALLRASRRIAEADRRLLLSLWRSGTTRAALVNAFRSLAHTWPRQYERQAWRSHLREIRHPALLLWGARDRMNSEEIAKELLLELPDASLYVHEECGHWPSLERPDWVVGKIREFLFRLEAFRETLRRAG
jgi:haloalkane dehalogenase